MSERNLITWSSMISMYTQHGQGKEALVIFEKFQVSSYENPNDFILSSVLRACTQLRDVKRAIQVHGFVVKAGFDEDLYVGTSLIDFYCKNGDIEEAKLVFDDLPVKTAVTWTTIIMGYARSGKSEVSLQLFHQMRETDVIPDRYVLSSVISACSVLNFLKGGKQIHAYVLRNGTETDISVINVLIDFYCKCCRVKIGRKLFDQMPVKNVVSWTTMIAGYMQNSLHQDAMKIFSEMTRLGWRPDGFTCTSILSSCGSLEALKQGIQVHSYIIKANLESDDFVKNGLIDMYAKCTSLEDARKAFDTMDEHNVISYNAMIEGYARQGRICEAVDLFHMMRLRSFTPSLLTFVSLLGVSASLSTIELSKQIHGLAVKSGVALDLYTGSALIDVYCKCFCVDDARLIFNEMTERDIVVWNAMVSGYTQSGQSGDALKLFLELLNSRIRPDELTFVALVTAASDLASLIHGQQFHSQLIKTSLDLEPFVSIALVDMYAKCGSIGEARVLFDSINQKDVVCWNSMISRYAQHGHANEALVMFDQMIAGGIVPTYVTFIGVLSACTHVGLVEIGLNHFESMKSGFGIEPGMEHYACVVDLLGKAGKLHEAKEFIEQILVNLQQLMVGDVELAKYAAEMAISVDPNDSGSYVLLSNILASKGMWTDVEKVRRKMNSNEVLKEPGHSWIEVNMKVNVFIAKDKTHNQAEVIYWVLQKLTEQIIDVDDTPELATLFGE
ncbi:hypothetical protein MKW92_046824 [Papaver armeniacum]|nr:hypothetical protein MKW92_046824 [Papaver armeniacum]